MSAVNGGHARQDVVSTTSTHSSRSDRNGEIHAPPAVESAVTRLLVAVKQLLEALTLWSELKVDDNQISDVYVRLGNDFNIAVAAFAAFNIDMSELLSVPDDLRTVLESCLAEDASPDNLAVYLPKVREIITNLLRGLRGKQSVYRRIVSDHKQRSDSTASSRSSRRQGDGSISHRRQPSQPGEGESSPRDSISRRGARISRRNPSMSQPPDPTFVGGFAPSVEEDEPIQTAQRTPSSASHTRHRSQPTSSVDLRDGLPDTLRAGRPQSPQQLPHLSQAPQRETTPELQQPPSSPPVAPPTMKRYSLVDRPISLSAPPPVIVEPTTPPSESTTIVNDNDVITPTPSAPSTPPIPPPPPIPEDIPPIPNSLAALKNRDALERRASKRWSTYNFTKLTGTSPGQREHLGRSTSNRRSMAASNALTPGDLDVLTEEDDHLREREAQVSPSGRPGMRREGSSRSRGRVTPEVNPPSALQPGVDARLGQSTPTIEEAEEEEETIIRPPGRMSVQAQESPTQFPVFLQLGREVKKVTIEPGLTFASLRVLFVDKFSYTPGQENFPAIYIRDPSSGVQYELEDVEEVKEKCLLSLNIEPLDQIKQHIDTQISSLAQDIKDLRSAVNNNNAHQATPIMDGPSFYAMAESTPMKERPSEQQFRHVARRLSRFMAHSPNSTPIPENRTPTQLVQQMTGTSVTSEYTSRVVSDLKTQFDEVQNLRRDLGVMRQLYSEFMNQTKQSLGVLRTQTQSVKQIASTKIGGERAFIDSGKKQLDLRSQDVLTEVERLQDLAETIRDDVLKRQISPKPQLLKSIKVDIDACAKELESLKQQINTVKPMWKKTWEEELQNIVEEQGFLTHQEGFLADLIEDHKAVAEVYGDVEKYIALRGSGSRGRAGPAFRPPPPTEGHGGFNTVLKELKGADVDPNRRLRAIEESQRLRKQELESRTDELQAELTDFVGNKKLKLTGGAEEVERVRQRKNEQQLKAMFNGPPSTPASGPMVNLTSLSFAAARDLPPSPSP